jgi:hypothetical protein
MRRPSLTVLSALLAAGVLGCIPVSARSEGSGQLSGQKPRVIIIERPDLRAPPAQPMRPITAPRTGREIAPPMDRPEPLPQMLPRVGN